MSDAGEFVTLVEDDGGLGAADHHPRWKVAVVDDDPAVHDGTRFALRDYVLNGHKLELLSAYSAAEAKVLLREHKDVAVVLLDVVMESDEAGLDLVDYIRKDLGNETVRIILRTGQPGQAPEQRVIVDYDINDYKAKTELTADKLFTTMTSALRSYEQLKRLDQTRRGLEIIVEAAPSLYQYRSIQRLAEGVLTQLASLLDVDCAGILVLREGGGEEEFSILAGSGCYQIHTSAEQHPPLDPELRRLILETFAQRCHQFLHGRYLLYVGTGSGREVVVLLEASKQLSETDRALVEVLCGRLSIAFDNVTLYEQLQRANSSLEERVARRTAELTLANERLQAQWARLRAANAFKTEILGKVAHDLKNPLSVIIGRTEILSELIAESPIPIENAKAQVAHIQNSAQRLTDMVDNLIADAMADALDISIRRETVDLVTLAADVVDANRPLAEQKQQAISLTGSSGATAAGDHDRLRDALDNLLSNAIKYSPIGGPISVTVERTDHEALIRVRDSGPGLSPEDTSRLFGRFQRLSAKPTGGESSTGLGLSIVKRIVDLHGGRIIVDNGPGGGATFTIALPATPPTSH
jgi:signal transduction histidine kinase/DNA-binding NarL/FixJ family response regulator